MIIVEGADNTGKSTLVRQLMELEPRLELMNRQRFKPERAETIGTSYLEALLKSDEWGIADRMLASECIYGELFRSGCRMTPEEHFAILDVLNSVGAIVVHTDVSDETVLANWNEREQLYDDPLDLVRAYRARIQDIFSSQTVVHYNWTWPDAEEARSVIIRLHEQKMKDWSPDKMLRDVRAFHIKFDLWVADKVGMISNEEAGLRADMMLEEILEFTRGIRKGDLAEAADALIDLVYFALGTAVEMGLPWSRLWDEVHRANMRKEAGHDLKRGEETGIIKPPGWREPNLERILSLKEAS